MRFINFIQKLGVAVLALILVLTGPAGAIIFILGRMISKFITSILVMVGFNRTLLSLGIGRSLGKGQQTPAHMVSHVATASAMIFTGIKVVNYLGF